MEFEWLKKYDVKKRNKAWRVKFEDFKLKLDNGFDIKTADDDSKRALEKMYDVKMTEYDEEFYLDNCRELEADLVLPDGSRRLKGQCKRIGLSIK